MAETVSAVVSEILAQGSFDLSSTEALAILNRRHKQMSAQARLYRSIAVATREATVGSTGQYETPDGLVELLQMAVTDSSGVTTAYTPTQRNDIAAMRAGTLTLVGNGGGVFVEFGVGGVVNWVLYPDPGVSGSVAAYGIYEPPDLLINNSIPFVVDDDLVEGLMAGVFATALNRPGEARPDLAATQEQLFQDAVREQGRRARRRYSGPGPRQIRLTGPQYT